MKRTLKIVGFFVGLMISSIIILALLVDANMFKPRLEALAAEKGIALDMRGDLHWQFWPSIGLAVNEIYIASVKVPTEPVAQVKKASFLMAVIPLLRGDFQVKYVLIDGAVIQLAVDEQGKNNWQYFLDAQEKNSLNNPAKTNPDVTVKSSDLNLLIEKLSLTESEIHYVDHKTGQRLALTEIELTIKDINTQGNPFDLKVAWAAQLSKGKNDLSPFIMKGTLQNAILLNSDYNAMSLTKGELKLELKGKSRITLPISYALHVNEMNTKLHYEGNFSVPVFNGRELLTAFGAQSKTANEKAFTDVNLSSKIAGDKNRIALSSLQVQLDKTHLNGSATITDFANKRIALNLQGDDINLDDYLAPETGVVAPEGVKSPAPVASHELSGDLPLPLATLRELNADIKISFTKAIFSALRLEKIQLDVDAKKGVIEQQLSADAYSGSIHQTSQIDARSQNAQISFDTILKDIALTPLLKDKKMDGKLKLSGAIQANAKGHASGVSLNQLTHSLSASANFSGAQVRLSPLNVEQKFCEFVSMVNRVEEPKTTWPEYTEMRELVGKITLANRVVDIENFRAGVEKLSLSSTGKINLVNKEYDFLLPLTLMKDATDSETSIRTSAQGCSVTSNYWAERSMSLLRCKGSFAEINPAKDCRPDKDALTSLTKDYAEYKLREKHGAKAEAKKAELIKKLDDKLGGEGSAEKTKALLKNLFKKRDE